MKYKILLRKLKENGWNMRFDAREQALIKDISKITEINETKLISKQFLITNKRKQMIVKDLIAFLNTCKPEQTVQIYSDSEGNGIYDIVEVVQETGKNIDNVNVDYVVLMPDESINYSEFDNDGDTEID